MTSQNDAAPAAILTVRTVIVRTRSFFIASVSYLAVLIFFFWPLLYGYVLHNGAETNLSPPFISNHTVDAVPFVNIWEADFREQFSVFEEYQYHSARHGRFPTWNPYIYAGQPFHADGQSAMLFPTHWIYFLIDPNIARGPMNILRLWVSAIALFYLLRRFQLAPTAAFIGGSVWIFGSFNMHLMLWPQSNASLWMPVMLVAFDWLLTKPNWQSYAVASLAAAPLFLAGHPGTIYICCICISVYVIIRLIGLARHRQSIRYVLLATGDSLAAAFTGLLLSAAAMLPLCIQMLHSFEFLDPTGHRNHVDPAPWNTLWLSLMPEYFGRPRLPIPGFDYSGPDNYIDMTVWFGALSLVLSLGYIGSMFLPPRLRAEARWMDRFSFLPVFGIVVFVLSFLFALKVWPIFQIFSIIPGTSLTNPRRFMVATQLAGAVLSACGVDYILARDNRTMALMTSVLALFGLVTVATVLAMRWDDIQTVWDHSLAAMPAKYGSGWKSLLPAMVEQYAGFRMIAGCIVLLIGTAVLLVITVLMVRQRTIDRRLRYLLAAIVTLDVLLPGYDFSPIAPLALAVPAAPQALKAMIQRTSDGRMTSSSAFLDPNMSMHYGFRDIRGYELPHNQRQALLFQRLGIDQFDNRALMKFGCFYPRIQPEMAAYLDRLCIRTLMLFHSDPAAAKKIPVLKIAGQHDSPGFMNWLQVAAPGDGVMVFTNPNAYPRTFLATSAEEVRDPATAMQALLNESVDLRDQSVYEGETDTLPPAAVQRKSAPPSTSLVDDEPERAVIQCHAESNQLLVLEDRMDDGWLVRVDGAPAKPLTANYMFRGVMVAPGDHTVEWTYHAPGFAAGIAISVTTFAGVTGLLITITFRRRGFTVTPPDSQSEGSQ